MNRVHSFFKALFARKIPGNIEKLVIVSHIIPDAVEFILSVNEFIPVAAVIPKPQSIDKTSYTLLSKYIKIINYTRSAIRESF